MSLPTNDKGKGRAVDVDERTPLLGHDASSSGQQSGDEAPLPQHPSTWKRPALTVGLLTLASCVVVGLVFVLVSGIHYASYISHVNPDQVVERGVVWKGPSNVEVVEVTAEAVTILVQGEAGIDADYILGMKEEDGTFIGRARKALGRWFVERVDQITVSLADIDVYAPYSRAQHKLPEEPLVTVSVSPFSLPLTTSCPDRAVHDYSWLSPLSLHIVVKPNHNASVLLDYAIDAWTMNRALARVQLSWVKVQGGVPKHWWEPWSLVEVTKDNIEKVFKYDFPNNPSTPGGPKGNDPVAELVNLRSYSIHSEPPAGLTLSADADIFNPLPPSIHGSVNMPLEFTISLLPQDAKPTFPDRNTHGVLPAAPIARVISSPIELTHPNITLSLNGDILPLPQTSLPLLGNFLGNFLSARASPISITSPPPFSLSINTVFPALKKKPEIIKKIDLQNMRMYPDPETGENLLTSATIIATVELPPGLDELHIDVGRILPDVLVYDGAPAELSFETSITADTTATITHSRARLMNDTGREPFPAPPLPSPLPSNAFARIRPPRWLNATSVVQPDPFYLLKNVTVVTAYMKDVPLDVLPGRDHVLTKFIQKVIFKGSALAGVKGDAAVGATVDGLPVPEGSDMELRGLPVEGVFTIHRKGTHPGLGVAKST